MSTPANYADAVERRDVTAFLMSRPCTPMPEPRALRAGEQLTLWDELED